MARLRSSSVWGNPEAWAYQPIMKAGQGHGPSHILRKDQIVGKPSQVRTACLPQEPVFYGLADPLSLSGAID